MQKHTSPRQSPTSSSWFSMRSALAGVCCDRRVRSRRRPGPTRSAPPQPRWVMGLLPVSLPAAVREPGCVLRRGRHFLCFALEEELARACGAATYLPDGRHWPERRVHRRHDREAMPCLATIVHLGVSEVQQLKCPAIQSSAHHGAIYSWNRLGTLLHRQCLSSGIKGVSVRLRVARRSLKHKTQSLEGQSVYDATSLQRAWLFSTAFNKACGRRTCVQSDRSRSDA